MNVYGPYDGVVRDIHDGDTCGVDLDVGFGMAALTRSVVSGKRLLTCRLYGLDAPELRIRVDGVGPLIDNPAGIAARDYLTSLIPAGTVVRVMSHLWDREGGRFDGEITRVSDSLNVNQEMIDTGHALPWGGTGPKP